MITYNHELFIAQAIEGVVNQKTNFNFELVIGEDCSTDNTSVICSDYAKRYPAIIKLNINKENIGAKNNLMNCFEKASGKYIAFCEGDDFWTDSYKLHKQVNFMEANPDYGLVHGDVNHLFQKTGKLIKAYNKTNNIPIPSGEMFEFLMYPSHSIKTMTVCLRRDLLKKYFNEIADPKYDFFYIDIALWLGLSRLTKFYYMDEVLATYRLIEESASRSKNPMKTYNFHQTIHTIRDFYMNKYDCSNEVRLALQINYYKSLLADAYNIMNPELSKKAHAFLKKEKINLSAKEKIYYYLNYFLVLRFIRKVF